MPTSKNSFILLLFLTVFGFKIMDVQAQLATCAFEDNATSCKKFLGVPFGYEMVRNLENGCEPRGCKFCFLIWYHLLFDGLDCSCSKLQEDLTPAPSSLKLTDSPSATIIAASSGPTTSSASESPTGSPVSSPTGTTPVVSVTGTPETSPTTPPVPTASPPTTNPTNSPTENPSTPPSAIPSPSPGDSPGINPADQPVEDPSGMPSISPSSYPSETSSVPSGSPSSEPTPVPSTSPSSDPTGSPSEQPATTPSEAPSSLPTSSPSSAPSGAPSQEPSGVPSVLPSEAPSSSPVEQLQCTDGTPNGRFCGQCLRSLPVTDTIQSYRSGNTYTKTYYYCQCVRFGDDSLPGSCQAAAPACFENEGSQTYQGFTPAQCDDNDRRGRLRRLSRTNGLDRLSKKELRLFGFIRVPKTGSTTLMKFLSQAKNLYTWDEIVHASVTDEEHASRGQLGSPNACFFGHVPERPKYRKMLTGTSGALVSKTDNSTTNIFDVPAATEGAESRTVVPFNAACFHFKRSKMNHAFEESVVSWKPGYSPDFRDAMPNLPSLHRESFVMIRDPFDRLVSYFYYLRGFSDTTEFLKETASIEQYKKVRANDLAGWMELLFTEGGSCGLEFPNQYPYVDEDVDKAIDLVQVKRNENDQESVVVLLTECFEASLHWLTNNIHGLDPGSIQPFVESESYRSNSNKKYDERPDKASLEDLREKAKIWFADDYRFYEASVDQFMTRIRDTKVPEEALKSCKYWSL